MLTIKIATNADADKISAISKQTFYEAFNAQNTKANMSLFITTNFNIQVTENDIQAKSNTFYLTYTNNQLCGYAKVIEIDNSDAFSNTTTLRISRIYVLDAFIGQGIGKALMQQCLNFAKELGKSIIWLGVWENNLPAIAFYQKWGFEKFGTEIFVLGNDPQTDCLMKKQL
jgi:ribosomal protein S18 acetylase RimI-like enzyme